VLSGGRTVSWPAETPSRVAHGAQDGRVAWFQYAASPQRPSGVVEKGDDRHGTHDTPAAAMSPATSAQVRRRQAARRRAVERQRQLNEERRQRDELELELAADFALSHEECVTAKESVQAAEVAMGRLVDRMIGELRLRYPRAAQLLEIPEDELRRLRQLVTEPPQRTRSPRGGSRTIDDQPSEHQLSGAELSDEHQRSRTGTEKPPPGRPRRVQTTAAKATEVPDTTARSPD
jgi:hypothetical protein